MAIVVAVQSSIPLVTTLIFRSSREWALNVERILATKAHCYLLRVMTFAMENGNGGGGLGRPTNSREACPIQSPK